MGTPLSPFSTGFWGENRDPFVAGHQYALISLALLKYSSSPVQDYKSMEPITETLVFSISIMEQQEYDDYSDEQPEFESDSRQQRQSNGSDCGFFAIANAIAVCNGQQPETLNSSDEKASSWLLGRQDDATLHLKEDKR